MVRYESVEEERETLRRSREEAAKRRADRAAVRSNRFNPAMATTKKKLSKWSFRGLDISEVSVSSMQKKASSKTTNKSTTSNQRSSKDTLMI